MAAGNVANVEKYTIEITEHSSVARPSKFNDRMVGLITALYERGATDNEVAECIGISVRTLEVWKNKHESFRQAMEDGKDVADDIVEATLFQRAVGWSQPGRRSFYNSKLDKVIEDKFVERFPPDVQACIHWLRCRRPEIWREINRQELSGPDGRSLEMAQSVQIVVALPANGREAKQPAVINAEVK